MDVEENTGDFAEFEAQANGEPEAPVEENTDTQEEQAPEEDQTDQDGEESADGDGEPEPKRNKKPAHERIAELTERARDAERREAEALRRLDALQNPQAPQEEGSGEPNPDDYDLGDMDPAYQRAVGKWEAEQLFDAKFAEFQNTVSAQSSVRQMQASYEERKAAVSEKYPDYDDVVSGGAARGEWPCTETVAIAIMQSDVGPDVAHFLATNKQEAVRIANLPPMEQAMAFGRLETRFLDKPQRKPTSAPPPPENRPRGADGRFQKPPAEMSFQEFEEHNRRQASSG